VYKKYVYKHQKKKKKENKKKRDIHADNQIHGWCSAHRSNARG
jgi:hypothetical protein